MKKKYIAPELDTLTLLSSDVITTSSTVDPSNPITGVFGKGDNEEGWL